MERTKQFFVYILRCSDGSYYVGYTEDIEQRVTDHNNGKVFQTDVRITHCHPDVAVAGKLFHLRQAGSLSEQFSDVTVTACRVKVGNSILVLMRDPDKRLRRSPSGSADSIGSCSGLARQMQFVS